MPSTIRQKRHQCLLEKLGFNEGLVLTAGILH